MDDCVMLAADCVVVCTCCPCLGLRLIVFLLLRLPRAAAKRAGSLLRAAARKLAGKRGRKRKRDDVVGGDLPGDPVVGVALDAACCCRASASSRCPIEAAEEVMWELYDSGEFGFGSFGRRGGGWRREPWSGMCQAEAAFVWEFADYG